MADLDAKEKIRSGPIVTVDQAQALWYVAPGKAEIRAEPLPAPAPGGVRLTAVASALSRGTERLVFAGRVPESEYERMSAPFMGGAFPFPVKYGYAMVARVEEGPAALQGRLAFALFPHQTAFNLGCENIVPLPDGLPPQRAVLGANMETALNALWDGAAGPADRIAVVGAGVLGRLVARLAAAMRAEVTVIDTNPARAAVAAKLGAAFAAPDKGGCREYNGNQDSHGTVTHITCPSCPRSRQSCESSHPDSEAGISSQRKSCTRALCGSRNTM